MNQRFRGTNIRIEALSLHSESGAPYLSAKIQFMSDEGVVHAHAQHKIPLDDSRKELQAAVADVVQRVTVHLEQLHFEQPATLPVALESHGIAEVLRARAGSPDEPGTQG